MKTAVMIVLAGLILGACARPDTGSSVGTLSSIHNDIAAALPGTAHIRADALQTRIARAPDTLMIFDTRPEAEYAVSHIRGAQRVDPKASSADLTTRFDVAGKDVVLYCSVGWRSSLLGEAAKAALLDAGAKSVTNLEGGLFGWHNDGRALVNAGGPTDFIHPYDDKWGQLIKNTDAARYTP